MTIAGFAWLVGAILLSKGALAQTPPLVNPNLDLQTNGAVFAMVRQADGGLVFNGMFATLEGQSRAGLARLQPDGSLDTQWNPLPSAGPIVLASCSDDAVYVNSLVPSEEFGQLQGLVKLVGSDGATDPTWMRWDSMYALACGPTDTLYAAALDQVYKISTTTGEADYSWLVYAANVGAIALDASGNIYIAGHFSTVNGVSRDRIAKLSAAGEVDPNWIATLPGTADDAATALSVGVDGNVFVGGPFGVQKLSNATGAPVPQWLPSTGSVEALVITTDGAAIYAGGRFVEMGGQRRTNLARLSTTSGIADPNWDPAPNSNVSSLIADADGGVQIGGSFDHIVNQDCYGVATLDSGGALVVPPLEVLRPGQINDIAARPDKSIIAGGNFLRANGLPRRHALRLFADGTLDPQWAPSLPITVTKLAVDGNDWTYLAGDEAQQGSQRTLRIVKVSGEGSGEIDFDWTSVANGWLRTLAVDHQGNLYAAGDFTAINDVARTGIAKLSPVTGDVDSAWNAMVDGAVAAISIDQNNNLYIGGFFSHLGAFSSPWAARLSSSDGTVDSEWSANLPGPVLAIAIDPFGDIYAGGQSSMATEAPFPFALKLAHQNGGILPEWSTELRIIEDLTPWAYSVSSIAVDANGTVYLAGRFGVPGDTDERTLARFSGQNGIVDLEWDPSFYGTYNDPLAVGADRLYVGGDFSRASGQIRQGLAAFETSLPDRLFATGFENGWPWP